MLPQVPPIHEDIQRHQIHVQCLSKNQWADGNSRCAINFLDTETNGKVECINDSLINILRKLVFNNQANWSTLISSVLLAYNVSLHSATCFSPFELFYGRKSALSLLLCDIISNELQVTPNKYFSKLVDTIINHQSKAFSNIYIRPKSKLLTTAKDANHLTNSLLVTWHFIISV